MVHNEDTKQILKKLTILTGITGKNMDITNAAGHNQFHCPIQTHPCDDKQKKVYTPSCVIQTKVFDVLIFLATIYTGTSNGLISLLEEYTYEIAFKWNRSKNGFKNANRITKQIRNVFGNCATKYVKKVFPTPRIAILIKLGWHKIDWTIIRIGAKGDNTNNATDSNADTLDLLAPVVIESDQSIELPPIPKRVRKKKRGKSKTKARKVLGRHGSSAEKCIGFGLNNSEKMKRRFVKMANCNNNIKKM